MSQFDQTAWDDAGQTKPDLQMTLEALKANEGSRPNATVLYGFSGLMTSEVDQLRPVWEELKPAYRRTVMRELIEVGEANIEMDYRAVGLMGLGDADAGVREAAIEVLWEDESLELMSRLVDLALRDDVTAVRAAAASALGRFILAGELGDLPEQETIPAQEAMVKLLKDPEEDVAVRRRALESIANCGHTVVPGAIREAYNSKEHQMRVSAVFAMGRTCDIEWEDVILQEIESEDPEMRYEAARASGELEMVDAVPKLARLVLEEDREIQQVAVWSLGEIGGKEAIRILNLLADKAEEDEDDDLLQAVEDAIGNASLIGGDFADSWMM